MEVYCVVRRDIKLSDPTAKVQLQAPLAYDNAYAHAMEVGVFDDDGTAADLTGIGVVGSFLKANNVTIKPINGTVSQNVAQVILPPSCYVTPGRFKFTLNLGKLTDPTDIDAFDPEDDYVKGDLVVYDSVVYRFTADHNAGAWTGTDVTLDGKFRTALWVEGVVEQNVTEEIVDPGSPIPNVSEAISNANAAASSAASAATSANDAAAAATAAVAALPDISTKAETESYLEIT